ncbi:hypothetical protein SO802_019719 [Lithocarpus litseifolius]|uniref:R13L1/DRL21-like LRR repeat region domain-containing protein n=1 Tax=Lithocarpus litseifolius TaxID=425828 RepID=A0AAW2CPW9_9ROSI
MTQRKRKSQTQMSKSGLMSLRMLSITQRTFWMRSLLKLCGAKWKLILQPLRVSGTSIKNMPIQMGRLQCLQTLTKFVVGKDIGFRIEELGKLSNLRGIIVISNLQNVINSTNALEAKLKDKEHLEELTLEWDAASEIISRSERDVLNNLQPHTSLTKLVVKNYNGTSFPNWVGDSSFSNITVVHLNSCRNCSSLPSLGQLPSLLDLFVFGFDEVVTVDADFYGSGSYTPFQSLKILRFKAMSKWEEWSPYHREGKDEGAFPSLQELYLEKCPKLSGRLPKHLPSLTELGIEECEQLETSLPTAPFIRKLVARNCNDALLKKLPPTLHDLTVFGFENLESLPVGVMDHNHCVEKLRLTDYIKKSSKTAPKAQHVTAPSVLFVHTGRICPTPFLPSRTLTLTILRQGSKGAERYSPTWGLPTPNLILLKVHDCLRLNSKCHQRLGQTHARRAVSKTIAKEEEKIVVKDWPHLLHKNGCPNPNQDVDGDNIIPNSIKCIIGKTYIFQVKVTAYNFFVRKQNFTITRVFEIEGNEQLQLQGEVVDFTPSSSLMSVDMSGESEATSSVRDGAGYDEIFPSIHEPEEGFSWSSERETSAQSPNEKVESCRGEDEELVVDEGKNWRSKPVRRRRRRRRNQRFEDCLKQVQSVYPHLHLSKVSMDDPLLSTPAGDSTLEETDDSIESEPDPKDDSVVLAQPAADPPVTPLVPSTEPQNVKSPFIQDTPNPSQADENPPT